MLITYSKINYWDGTKNTLQIPLNIFQPVFYISKSFLVGDIICDYHSVSTTVVALCDSSEPFLTCSVPNLQLKHKEMIYLSEFNVQQKEISYQYGIPNLQLKHKEMFYQSDSNLQKQHKEILYYCVTNLHLKHKETLYYRFPNLQLKLEKILCHKDPNSNTRNIILQCLKLATETEENVIM